ncbi:MAG TPA: VWA-like domain-containing protein [Oligoflexia bacterium]|nr:VWA-like domain-containing protein [Oligoflexia bacterium]HMP48311.1 VWA-like domain-containing protein [Oligoflexia bacterium]
MKKQLEESLIKTRNEARKKVPYFGPELFSLTPVVVNGLGTLAVDKFWRLYVDPEYFFDITPDERVGVLVHEMYHPLSLHFLRAERKRVARANKLLWNIAADLEINQKVLADEMVLPKGALLPGNFGFPEGLIAEQYFDLLLDLPRKKFPVTFEKSGSGEGGSGVSGYSEPYEVPENDPDTPGVSPYEGIQKVNSALRRERDARNREANPMLTEILSELIGTPKVPWTNILRNLLRRSVLELGKSGAYRTYQRPSRRSYSSRLIMPRNFHQTYRIGIVLDTSGSMLGKPITEAYRELAGLCSHAGKCTVICCDADPAPAKEIFGGNVHNLKLLGGGGTDMRVGIKQFEASKEKVDVVIVFTDGATPWPLENEMPPFSLIAAIVSKGSIPPPHIPCVKVE